MMNFGFDSDEESFEDGSEAVGMPSEEGGIFDGIVL